MIVEVSLVDNSVAVLWEFVPPDDYLVPGFVGLSSAVKKWIVLKQFFRRNQDDSMTPARSEADLRMLPQVRLENLVPPIDWGQAALGLDNALQGWIEEKTSDLSVLFVIGQPWCGHGETIEKWAAVHGADMVVPPTHSEILSGDPGWLDQWPIRGRPWVLPHLEHCYLRHAQGLGLVRDFLERAARGSLGKGLIGCDSWAWAYIQRVWPVAQPRALTLQAFDGEKLTRFFFHLAEAGMQEQICFRNAGNGNRVIPSFEEMDGGGYTISRELKQLAAHCRGNPGTAWTYWRRRLRSEPDEGGNAAAEKNEGEVLGKQGKDSDVIWLAADIADPSMPMEADEDMAFVLHGLLLHNGLPVDALSELLPLSRSRVMSLLLRLKGCELVTPNDDDCWTVSALGYAVVRRFLHARDFLTDAF